MRRRLVVHRVHRPAQGLVESQASTAGHCQGRKHTARSSVNAGTNASTHSCLT